MPGTLHLDPKIGHDEGYLHVVLFRDPHANTARSIVGSERVCRVSFHQRLVSEEPIDMNQETMTFKLCPAAGPGLNTG